MALQCNQIAKLFRQAAGSYLQEHKQDLKYRNYRFALSEKELQKHFAMQLFDHNLAFRRERYFSAENNQRIDFRIYDEDHKATIQVEIEWEATHTDGFANRTFQDMEKLNQIKRGDWGMFLALNIGNKYTLPKREMQCKDPESFAVSRRTGKPRPTYLLTRWRNSADNSLLRCNPKFWYWPMHISDDTFTVCVLSCYGRRVHKGWSAT